ncbi:MAG: hypothetical protein JO293_00030, partial [Candidatus Eremiobacteraeota bacterium]|nr:hypothetical protein [Candidatus Eremiobacteraeota bacterium]
KPLVVGGESDIDYEDGDESAVVVVPDKAKPLAPVSREESETGAGPRRRRRRRGRGGRKPSEERESVAPAADAERSYDEHASEDDADISTEHEHERERRPRRFTGPIRQLYGAPVELTSEEAPTPHHERDEAERPTRDEGDRPSRIRSERRAPRDASRSTREPRHARPSSDERYDEAEGDELDTVVAPGKARAVDIEFLPPGSARRRHRDEEQETEPRRDGRMEREPREREPRERGRGRGDRERGGRGDRDRGGRGGRGASRPTGPGMRQLYPPPGVEPEPPAPADGDQRPVTPFGKRRPSHGALFGGAGEAPPKGKVRQLYPPSFGEPSTPEVVEPVRDSRVDADSSSDVERAEGPAWTNSSFDSEEQGANGGLFVADEHELEERRRRARERAEQRQLDDTEQ